MGKECQILSKELYLSPSTVGIIIKKFKNSEYDIANLVRPGLVQPTNGIARWIMRNIYINHSVTCASIQSDLNEAWINVGNATLS